MDTLLFYSAIVLDIDLVKIQVTGCWYKQAHVRVAMLSTVCIPASFWGAGSKKYFIVSVLEWKSIILRYLYIKWCPYMSLFQYRRFEREGDLFLSKWFISAFKTLKSFYLENMKIYRKTVHLSNEVCNWLTL